MKYDFELKGHKILLVDDEKFTRNIVAKSLEHYGLEIAEASSGKEALKILPKFKPDLILLDIMMDEMNGFQVCSHIKDIKEANNIPIIFLTSLSDPSDIVKGLTIGGCDYLIKPFQVQEGIARIKVHLQLRHLIEHKEQLIDTLRKADLNKSEIINITANDIKNSIMSIRILAKYLKSKSADLLNKEQTETIHNIYEESDHLASLIHDLLDFCLLEYKKMRLNISNCNFEELVANEIVLYKSRAQQKGLEIELLCQEGLEPIAVDVRQAQKAVHNILSNTVKFSPKNSKILVSIKKIDEILTISFEDEGAGVAKNELQDVFEAFVTGSSKPTGEESSTGLGLFITKKVMEAHNGYVTIENKSDRGCIVTLNFPIRSLKEASNKNKHVLIDSYCE